MGITGRLVSTNETVTLNPTVEAADECVYFFKEGQAVGDPAWCIDYFEGKSNRIKFKKYGDTTSIPEITDITLNPAPTMTYLNPRPATGSFDYPWRWADGNDKHVIKLPLQLAYSELREGSQIVVSGVTEALSVIEGTLGPNNVIEYRAGGLLIAQALIYDGEKDIVTIYIMEDFTGEILAVNFDKAFKNLPAIDGLLNESGGGPYHYIDSNFNNIARCVLNGYCLGLNPIRCLPSVSEGDVYRVFQSIYVANVGDAIETSIVWGGRDLYVIQVGVNYKLKVILPIMEDGWLIQYPEI